MPSGNSRTTILPMRKRAKDAVSIGSSARLSRRGRGLRRPGFTTSAPALRALMGDCFKSGVNPTRRQTGLDIKCRYSVASDECGAEYHIRIGAGYERRTSRAEKLPDAA